MKQCRDCKRFLPLSCYHKDKTNRDRLRTRCKECRKKLAQIYFTSNYKEISNRRRELYENLKVGVLKKFGSKCLRCGFSDWRALQIDHINGGGHKERSDKTFSAISWYRKVLADKSNKYQLLCANCNWIKRYEQKELTGTLRIGGKEYIEK